MGLKPNDLHTLTIGDFALMHLAFLKKEERKDIRARRIVEAIVNYSGFGREKFIPGSDVWPLTVDTEDQHQYVVNIKMALELLEGF